MERLNEIIIENKSYPVKIDMNVLESIQEKYESIQCFEIEILGLSVLKDKQNNVVKDTKGKPVMVKGEPSIKAIKFILPIMINEGLEIRSDEQKIPFVPVTEKEIFRQHIDFKKVAEVIYEEFARCFETKKYYPCRAKKKVR